MPEPAPPPDDYNQAAFNLIVGLRGGLPERCDFCDQPFTQERYPIPEEGGEWACNACYVRWGYHPPKE